MEPFKKLTSFKLRTQEELQALKKSDVSSLLIDFCLWMKTEWDWKNDEPATTLVKKYLKEKKSSNGC